jgi:hypothetical protein
MRPRLCHHGAYCTRLQHRASWRLTQPFPCYSLDPCSAHHAVYVDAAGTIHYMYMDSNNRSVVRLASFAIHYSSSGHGSSAAQAATSSSQLPLQRLRDPLQDFALIPNMPGEVLLVQRDSCRVLHAALPRQLGQGAPLSVFGTHQGGLGGSCRCTVASARYIWPCVAAGHLAT